MQWVFGSEGVLSLVDESYSATSWEVLYNAINKTIAREQVLWGLACCRRSCGTGACASCIRLGGLVILCPNGFAVHN